MRTKKSGYTKTDAELAKELRDWVKQQQTKKKLDGLVESLDFTFTSHRTARRYTWGLWGLGTPRKRQIS